MFTVGNTAKLFCDKLLIQQQQLQPLFLCLSFFCSLYSAYFLSIPILEWFTSFPGRKMVFLSFPFLSFFHPILSYRFASYFLAYPIHYIFPYPLFHSIPSYPILLHPFLFLCRSYTFASLFLCMSCIHSYFFAYSYPSHLFFLCLSYPFISFWIPFSLPCLVYPIPILIQNLGVTIRFQNDS